MPRPRREERRRRGPRPSGDIGTSSCRFPDVVQTLEHRRFVEFCDACRRYRYIGLCYGASGVGKTLSARYYANWDRVQAFWSSDARTDTLLREVCKGTTAFYTTPVMGSPGQLQYDISRCRALLHDAAVRRVQRREEARTERLAKRAAALRDPRRNPGGYLEPEARKMQRAADQQRYRIGLSSRVSDPTTLLVIDEADRLKVAGLEQVRSIFDVGGLGLILIGMPGIEKRLARFPQLRITGGNFRLLNRLLTQTERILEINALRQVTKEAVEAARESLVIGEA